MKPSRETVELFAKDRFATCNGAVIDEVGEHYAKCSLKLEDIHRNAMGAVMGGVYFTLPILPWRWRATGRKWAMYP